MNFGTLGTGFGGMGRGGAGPTGITNADMIALFGGGEKGFIYDPVTQSGNVGDAVSSLTDLSPNGAHATQGTGAKQPLIQSDANGRHIDFDGTDDFLATAALDFSGTNKVTLVTGLRIDGGASTRVIIEQSASAVTNNGACALVTRNTANGDLGWNLRGDAAITGFTGPSATLPRVVITSCVYDISGGTRATEIFPRTNGAIPSLTGAGGAESGAGNFGNYVFYFGGRAGTSLFYDGAIYPTLLIGRALSAADILKAENWVAGKMGISPFS